MYCFNKSSMECQFQYTCFFFYNSNNNKHLNTVHFAINETNASDMVLRHK